MNSKKLLVLFLIGVVITSCFVLFSDYFKSTISRSDVIGEFNANHGKGLDKILLQEDGTYIHTFQNGTERIISNSEKWTFTDRSGESRLTFNNFTFLQGVASDKSGYWDVEVERLSGTLRLNLDPDLNYFYKKND